jgi:hypothetical protein
VPDSCCQCSRSEEVEGLQSHIAAARPPASLAYIKYRATTFHMQSWPRQHRLLHRYIWRAVLTSPTGGRLNMAQAVHTVRPRFGRHTAAFVPVNGYHYMWPPIYGMQSWPRLDCRVRERRHWGPVSQPDCLSSGSLCPATKPHRKRALFFNLQAWFASRPLSAAQPSTRNPQLPSPPHKHIGPRVLASAQRGEIATIQCK